MNQQVIIYFLIAQTRQRLGIGTTGRQRRHHHERGIQRYVPGVPELDALFSLPEDKTAGIADTTIPISRETNGEALPER